MPMSDLQLNLTAIEAQKKRDADKAAQAQGFADDNELQKLKAQQAQMNDYGLISSGGFKVSDDMVRRASDFNYGLDQGKKLFYDDPGMQELLATRKDLAKGYDSSELGAMRETARGEIAGQRNNQQRTLSSNLAKGGVGGARAAAIRNTADQKYNATTADSERKMALDSANMRRQGQNDLQDFMMRQKMGQLAVAAGNAQMGSADYGAQKAAEANKGDDGGMCFITTAACQYYGLPDDCDELQTLRKFRDEIMLTRDDWKQDVADYYALAKELGEKLSAIKDFHFWTDVFGMIKEAVGYCKDGEHQKAYDTYKLLIEFVKGAF